MEVIRGHFLLSFRFGAVRRGSIICFVGMLVLGLGPKHAYSQYVWEAMEGPPEKIVSLAYGNGTFVGLGESGLVYASADEGENWTAAAMGHGRPAGVRDTIVFDGEQFCALIGRWSATSPNGVDWTVQPIVAPESFDFAHLKFADATMAHYIAIRTISTSTQVWTSSDMVQWERSDSLFGWFDGFAYGNDRFLIATVGGALGGDNRYVSEDGLDFTQLNTGSNALLGFANGRFYEDGGGGGLRYSTDGATWQSATTQPFGGGLFEGGVIDLNGQTVIVASQGMLRSDDGVFFTYTDHNIGYSSFFAAAGSQETIVLSSRNAGSLYLSNDGQGTRIPSGGSRLIAQDPERRPDLIHSVLMPNDGAPSEQIYFLASSSEDLLMIRGVGENTFDWTYPNSPENLEYSSFSTPDPRGDNGTLYIRLSDTNYASNDGLNFVETDSGIFNNGPQFNLGNDIYSGLRKWTGLAWLSPDFGSATTPTPSEINSMAYGNGTYVGVGMTRTFGEYVWASTDGREFEAYSIASVDGDDPVFFIDGRFVYCSIASAFVAANGLSGSDESYYWKSSGESVAFDNQSFAQAGDFLFGQKRDGSETAQANVNASFGISRDGIAFEQIYGLASANFQFYGLDHFQYAFHHGDSYYAISANGSLLRSPDHAQASPVPSETVLQNLPDLIEFTVGDFVSHALNVPENTRFTLISGLPTGIRLRTAEATIEGAALEEGLFEDVVLSIVTNSMVYQKTVTLKVDPAEAVLSLDPTSRSHGSAATTDQSVAVVANVAWSVSTTDAWIALGSSEGMGAGDFTYSLSENVGAESRSGVITVTAGSLEKTFAVEQAGTSDTLESWYTGASNLGGDWRYLPWLRSFNISQSPWIFHAQHGWLFPFGDDPSAGMYFWDVRQQTFLYTTSSFYPTLFRFSDGKWIRYQIGSRNPRWFVDLQSGVWEQVE